MTDNLCTYCGSSVLIKRGSQGDKQKMQCKDCGKYMTFSASEDEPSDLGKSSYTETSKGIDISVSSSEPMTQEEIIALYAIDTDKWKLVSYQVTNQQVYRKDRKVKWKVRDGKVVDGDVDDSGKMLVVPITHIKVKFAPKTPNDLTIEDIDNFFANYKRGIAPPVSERNYISSARRLEIVMADLHIGSRDMGIAERAKRIVRDILYEVDHMNFARIMLVFLGDTLHYDTAKKTTTSGTAIDFGMLPKEMYDAGEALIIEIVEMLKDLAPVDVVWLEGNHDRMMSYGLFKGISNYYMDDVSVTVDTSHKTAKWRQFGQNLVLWHHGDISIKKLPDLVTVDAREDFGKSTHVEIHAAHRHHSLVEDLGGIILRLLPTIAKHTDWELGKGYRAQRASQAFVWDDEIGITQIIQING